jgi:hypothetical protein
MKTIPYTPLILVMFFFSQTAFSLDSKPPINTENISHKCFSKEWTKPALVKLKADKFVLEDKTKKEALSLQLLNCLANSDAKIRDGIAFETLSFWLRNSQLSNVTHLGMFAYLTDVIESEVNDSNGVYQTFSMLVLSEIARVDRKTPFLTDAQRDRLVNIGTDFLTNLRDYRGFTDKEGWRHGVAHSSDLMLQLALNLKITKTQLNSMLDALASQVTANEQHAYIHGEPKRIAMAVLYIFLRKQHSVEDWNKWLSKVTTPSPFNQWQDVYKSENGLTKLHNTQSFLYSLYATIKASKNETLIQMVPALEKAIKEVN